jgi:hypothetical protein
MMPLQPLNSLKDPIDGFTHIMQALGHPHDSPTEPIDIRLVCNSLLLEAFTPGMGM